MPTVLFDARDAFVPMPHGSGIAVRGLLGALPGALAGTDITLDVVRDGGPGPELLFEQIALPRRLRRERPALVHSPDCFLPLRRPCPGIVNVYDLAFDAYPHDFSRVTGWKFRTFVPRALRSAERVVCCSRFTADDVMRRFGVPEERVRVVPLAPALAVGDAPTPAGGRYMLAVGDLRPKKDLATLVRAFAQLHRSGAIEHRLVVAGLDLGEGDALARLARDAPVELAGFVTDADLDALMRGADLFVQPSLYEGFGLAIIEAMARGVPVALSRASVHPETGGDAAEYFEPRDVDDCARAVAAVLGDDARREALVARGRARAGALSWEATAAATVAVYRELL
jgi:glycosyltransferase involved in cell wall biosynthesis